MEVSFPFPEAERSTLKICGLSPTSSPLSFVSGPDRVDRPRVRGDDRLSTNNKFGCKTALLGFSNILNELNIRPCLLSHPKTLKTAAEEL